MALGDKGWRYARSEEGEVRVLQANAKPGLDSRANGMMDLGWPIHVYCLLTTTTIPSNVNSYNNQPALERAMFAIRLLGISCCHAA